MDKLVRLWKRPSRDGKTFVFVLVYRDECGKKRYESLGHADSRKAERQRSQKERELRMGVVELASMRLADLLDDYVHNTEGQITPTTMAEAQRDMKEFIAVVGNLWADRAAFNHAEEYLRHCLAKGKRPATVNKKLRHLHRVFELSKRRGHAECNPIHGICQLKIVDKPVWAFSDDDVGALVRAVPSTLWRTRILSARCAGLRIGEILNLTFPDIRFDEGIVIVQPKEDTASTWAWHPKDYELRELPLSDEATELLGTLRKDCSKAQPYPLIGAETYLKMLRRRQQGQLAYAQKRLPEPKYSKEFQRIRGKAQLVTGTMHDLRRAAITAWAENPNLQPHEVMKLAGHSSLETTLKYYVHLKRSMLDRARGSNFGQAKGKLVARALRAAL